MGDCRVNEQCEPQNCLNSETKRKRLERGGEYLMMDPNEMRDARAVIANWLTTRTYAAHSCVWAAAAGVDGQRCNEGLMSMICINACNSASANFTLRTYLQDAKSFIRRQATCKGSVFASCTCSTCDLFRVTSGSVRLPSTSLRRLHTCDDTTERHCCELDIMLDT